VRILEVVEQIGNWAQNIRSSRHRHDPATRDSASSGVPRSDRQQSPAVGIRVARGPGAVGSVARCLPRDQSCRHEDRRSGGCSAMRGTPVRRWCGWGWSNCGTWWPRCQWMWCSSIPRIGSPATDRRHRAASLRRSMSASARARSRSYSLSAPPDPAMRSDRPARSRSEAAHRMCTLRDPQISSRKCRGSAPRSRSPAVVTDPHLHPIPPT
jgi:hypothetical protein